MQAFRPGALVALLAAFTSSDVRAAGPVALRRPETQPVSRAAAELQIGSTAFQPNGAMPTDLSGYGRNVSPPLSWSAGPPGTKAYALMVEDPDAPTPEPAVHWLAWDIPADMRSVSRGMRNLDRPKTPAGMVQGANYHGSLGYSGPRPPVGDPPHHYHFQVFALDRALRVKPGADRGALLKAMRGHVLARGELVGLYGQPAPRPARGEHGAGPQPTR
jgi:Raf kinase inhibitor-like YbhB/YbcL family protein